MAKGPGTVLPDPDGIAERWGLAQLPPPELLEGGHRNTLLRCGDMVLRVMDPERSARFLAAYAEADGPGELAPFDDLLRLRLVADALYSLTSAARGEPWSLQYVEHLLRALEQFDD